MNINSAKAKLELSGKGMVMPSPYEWKNDNIKATYFGEFLCEVVDARMENEKLFFGWLAISKMQILSDFTIHTENGMKGQSNNDNLEDVLIMDSEKKFVDGELSILQEEILNRGREVLQKFKSKNYRDHDIQDSHWNLSNNIIFISLEPELVLVQGEESSVRAGKGGVSVLQRSKDSLVNVNSDDGVQIINNGKQIVEINKQEQIIINGHQFHPEKIMENVGKSIANIFEDMVF